MLLRIADQTIRILEEDNLPDEIRSALQIFRVEDDGDTPRFCINIQNGMVEEGACCFASRQLEIRMAENGKVLRLHSNPMCAMLQRDNEKRLQLYIYEDSHLDEGELSEQVRLLLRLGFEFFAASDNRISLHASAFVHEGRCICVTGASGAGKSTLTANWIAEHPSSFVLNGDRPVLYCGDDGIEVYGAPWSGKEHIFKAANSPLFAVVEVRKHCTNQLVRLKSLKAYKILLQRVSKVNWNAHATAEIMASLEKLVQSVPAYRYYCRDDRSAGADLYRMLYDEQGNAPIMKGITDLKIKKDYVVRHVLDEYIAVPVGNSTGSEQKMIVLNEVSAFIWKQLEVSNSYDAILEKILSEYEVEEQAAKQDLDEFLDMLRNAELLDEE